MSASINSSITIFFFPEPWENRLFGPIDRITILVDSQTMTVPFTVPTGDFNPENGTPDFFKRWIQRIQGSFLSRTGITEEERELLLHFALGYRAFYANRDDIPADAYYEFVGQLVADTLALCPPKPAAHALEAAVEWLLGNLPGDVFDDPDVLPVTPYMPTAEDEDEDPLAGREVPTGFSPTGALIEMCHFLVPARTTYGVRASTSRAQQYTDGQSIIRIPPSSISTERAYMVLPTAPQTCDTDHGYASDDSMPSLHYVHDSSDDE